MKLELHEFFSNAIELTPEEIELRKIDPNFNCYERWGLNKNKIRWQDREVSNGS